MLHDHRIIFVNVSVQFISADDIFSVFNYSSTSCVHKLDVDLVITVPADVLACRWFSTHQFKATKGWKQSQVSIHWSFFDYHSVRKRFRWSGNNHHRYRASVRFQGDTIIQTAKYHVIKNSRDFDIKRHVGNGTYDGWSCKKAPVLQHFWKKMHVLNDKMPTYISV